MKKYLCPRKNNMKICIEADKTSMKKFKDIGIDKTIKLSIKDKNFNCRHCEDPLIKNKKTGNISCKICENKQ